MTEDLLRGNLPDPWTFGVANDGRVFFINDEDKKTTWLHPDTEQAIRSGFRQRKDLPLGWEEGYSATGASYYINHNKGTTTFNFPEHNVEKAKTIKKSKKAQEPLYQNIDNETLKQEKKKRRNSSFLERSGINIFRRSSSKSREKPEEYKRQSRKMKEKRPKSENRKPKAARPTSATSVTSSRSTTSIRSKMTASWRDTNKEIVMSGWLYKQDSTGKMKMWRKKWFVLADFCLYYYKDAKEEEILGSIILPSYSVDTMTVEDKINRKYAFKVQHAGMRTYYLSADSYNDMASWITALKRCCQPSSPKTDKAKETEPKSEEAGEATEGDSKGSKSKNKTSVKSEEDSDSEFGFNNVRAHPPTLTASSQSSDGERTIDNGTLENLSTNNNKHSSQYHETNGKVGPAKRQDQPPHEQQVTSRKAHENYQQRSDQLPSANEGSGHNRSAERGRDRNVNRAAHRPRQNTGGRRENGESAYFSDTSGATDGSGRVANPNNRNLPPSQQQGQRPSNTQHGQVKRNDSLTELGNWVTNQKMRHPETRSAAPSNFDTASDYSSVSQQHARKSATINARGPRKTGGPPSSRRYTARTYNEYMDPMEVASSTISMPPIQQHANRTRRAQTMPRPQSTEDIDRQGAPVHRNDFEHRMTSSKSAGNVTAADQEGAPTPRGKNSIDNSKRTKSDYVIQNGDELQQQYLASFRRAQSKGNQVFRASRQQHKTSPRPQSATRSGDSGRTPWGPQQSPQSAVTPNNVFSPVSNSSSSMRSDRDESQVFRFEGRNDLSSKPDNPPLQQRTSDSSYEVKQIQRGQFRAFVLSAKSPPSQLPPPERQTPLKPTENVPKTREQIPDGNIEARLKRFNECEGTLHRICNDVASLQAGRERLEADSSIARSRSQNRYSAVDTQQHRLEQELGNVKAQLANAAEKLKDLGRGNENFEQEIRKLKSSIMDQLRNQSLSSRDREAKKRLELDLGRVGFILEGLAKHKLSIQDKIAELNRGRGEDDILSISPTSPPGGLSANGRSPRDVKRMSLERRSAHIRPFCSSSASSSGTPDTTPVKKKYFTLPGRGVPHATSVDSVTAESLAKITSPRPTSARSVSSVGSSTMSSLQRTRSASERLFNAQYGKQGSEHEAREMKRLQKEILRNRRNNLKSGSVGDMPHRYSANLTGMTLPARTHLKVGTDLQMALKHHRMPKVLQRAKRDRAETTMNNQIGFEIDELERNVTGKEKSVDSYLREAHDLAQAEASKDPTRRDAVPVVMEPEEIDMDASLAQQLVAPGKVEIPERYVEYESFELSPDEEKLKHKKVAAIEKMLAKSGQQASLPAVHLAAALAVEAGSVARAVAMHASAPQRQPGDGQKDRQYSSSSCTITDESLSAEGSQNSETLMIQDPEYTRACIV